MSREEKEKLLNQKMENIRRKNEELRKRHQVRYVRFVASLCVEDAVDFMTLFGLLI